MRHRSARTRLKYLSQSGYFPSGNPRFYFGKKGNKRVPLPDAPQTSAVWMDAYNTLLQTLEGKGTRKPTIKGSIREALNDYKATKEHKGWLHLATSTKDNRKKFLDEIEYLFGDAKLEDLKAEHIEAYLDQFSGNPANSRLKAWQGFCRWLSNTRKLKPNPCKSISKRYVEPSKGHVPMTRDEIGKFREFWAIGTKEREAFEIIFWPGCRISDAVGLGEYSISKDGWLEFVQQKTKGKVAIPVRRDLPDFAYNNPNMIEDLNYFTQAISARNDRHMTFMTTMYGKPRSIKGASQWFSEAVRKAGIEGRTAHSLRKSRAIELVYCGCTPHEIGAWTGHKSFKEIEEYTEEYDRKLALSRKPDNEKVPTFQK